MDIQERFSKAPSPVKYQLMAEEIRTIASTFTSSDTTPKQTLLRLASDYDKLAESLSKSPIRN